jgi:hypothetical protein
MADTEQTPPRLPKPESLEAKFKLLALLPYDDRVRRKHSLVLGFLLDWYHSKYGDALASVRHVVDHIKARDPAGKGIAIAYAHSALSDLVSWGYLKQDKGSGKRASRYVPAWDLVCLPPSVHTVVNATPSVHPVLNTDVHTGMNANSASVHNGKNEDPSTRTRSQDPGTRKDDNNVSAAPTAPHASGLVAAAAVPAEEFEQLYRTYGVRKNKAAAEAEFLKLNSPIADLIVSANAWKAAAGDGVTRMYLDRWLREKRYDEDPPAKYEPKPGKVKMPRKQAGAVRRDVELQDVLWDGGFGPIDISLKWNDAAAGEPVDYELRLYGDDYPKILQQLGVTNPSDLEFKRALLDLHTDADGTETYRWHRYPDAANDNLVREGESDEVSASRHLRWEEAA